MAFVVLLTKYTFAVKLVECLGKFGAHYIP